MSYHFWFFYSSSPSSFIISFIDFYMSSILFPISSPRPTMLPDISSNLSCICFSIFWTKAFNSFVEGSYTFFLSIFKFQNLSTINYNLYTGLFINSIIFSFLLSDSYFRMEPGFGQNMLLFLLCTEPSLLLAPIGRTIFAFLRPFLPQIPPVPTQKVFFQKRQFSWVRSSVPCL